MDIQSLNNSIMQGIFYEDCGDHIVISMPFFFGNNSEPLRLVWNNKGVLSDRGRTIAELKDRLGDIAPYKESIQLSNMCF